MGKLNLTYADYDNEKSTVGVYTVDLSDANWTLQATQRAAFEAAIADVVIGELQKTTVIAVETQTAGGPAGDPSAQRERKWLMRGTSSTGFPVTFEIPCADASLLEANGPRMDPASAEWVALKAAADAYARNNRGETVTFTEAVLVGRNI